MNTRAGRLRSTLGLLALSATLLWTTAADAARKREGTDWFIHYAYSSTDTKLPRVLLVGDSICNGYQDGVRRQLAGVANVSFLATSKCVTDDTYLKLLSLVLGEQNYAVIHFNNGLHSLGTDRAEWGTALRAAFDLLKKEGGGAKIIWATSTPLKDANLTAKAKELNDTAAPIVKEYGFPTDDLFALMDPLDRAKYWSDTFHYHGEGREMQAKQVADSVKPLLAGWTAPAAAPVAAAPAGAEVKNGNFETDGQWSLYPPKPEAGSITYSTDNPHGGQRCAKVTANQGGLQFYQYAPGLAAGATYQLTWWARADQPAKVTAHVRTQKPPYKLYGNHTAELTTEWQKFSVEFTLPEDYRANEHVLFFNCGGSGVFYFDDIRCERK